jgi:hypothetical protein
MAHPDKPTRAKARHHEMTDESADSPFQSQVGAKRTNKMESLVHVIGKGIICDTDRRGNATPQGRSPLDIVVDASQGFIPLWTNDAILRWRFRERSMDYFEDPQAAKAAIRGLFAEALLAWGTAAPVTFKYDEDLWDFELVMRSGDDCTPLGCVLASAFFPGTAQSQLQMYPKMFTQSHKEQVDTFIHEIGHIFGLRHFFANLSETAWPSEIFGRHERFSIMNYEEFSELTDTDREDLTLLYELVWSGELTHINGTPIRLFRPYSSLATVTSGAASCYGAVPMLQPQTAAWARASATSTATRARGRAIQSRSKAAYLDGN